MSRWPNKTSRAFVIDRVRIRALTSLWQRDDQTWDRCCDLLDRDAKRIQRGYTTQRQEVCNAGN